MSESEELRNDAALGDAEEINEPESNSETASETKNSASEFDGALLSQFKEQSEMFEQLIRNQIQVKDEIIDKLHRELEGYKQDQTGRFVEQFVKSFLKLHISMMKNMRMDTWENMSADDLRKEYQYAFEDLTDLLEQQNVEMFETKENEDFDPAIHQARVIKTDDPALDRKVKRSLTAGYRLKDKVILPEKVEVYQSAKETIV